MYLLGGCCPEFLSLVSLNGKFVKTVEFQPHVVCNCVVNISLEGAEVYSEATVVCLLSEPEARLLSTLLGNTLCV